MTRTRGLRSTLVLATVLGLLAGGCGSSNTDPTTPTSDAGPATTTASTTTPSPSPAGPLEVSLATPGGSLGGTAPLTVTLTNRSDADVVVVRPFAIPNFVSLRIVDASGSRVPFLGPHYRFAPLEDEFFVELAPGEEVDHTFDLSIGYRLEAGNYEVIAEYLNPAGGSHEGTRAIVFEPGDGPMSPAMTLEVSP